MNASLLEARQRVKEVEARTDETLGDLIRDPFVWAARLRLSKVIEREALRGGLQAHMPEPKGTLAITSPENSAPIAGYKLLDGALHLYKTENERIALGATGSDKIVGMRISKHEATKSIGLRKRLLIRRTERHLGLPQATLLSDVVRARRMLSSLRDLIDETQPNKIVLAATEHIFCRVLAILAREREIPTALIPHAPTPVGQAYADAPFDELFLRGQGDVDYYSLLGSRTNQLRLVGDPSLTENDPDRKAMEPLMLASTADMPAANLERTVGLCRDLLGYPLDQIAISPHPRGKRRAEEVGSKLGLRVLGRRTSQTLQQYVPEVFVTESSSGSRLEAELAGVASLSADNPYYLFEFSLPRFPEDAKAWRRWRKGVVPKAERAERARHWVAAVGTEAERRIGVCLNELTFRTQPALDAWNYFGH